jgi:hypothetical protein
MSLLGAMALALIVPAIIRLLLVALVMGLEAERVGKREAMARRTAELEAWMAREYEEPERLAELMAETALAYAHPREDVGELPRVMPRPPGMSDDRIAQWKSWAERDD